jgi:hypothetical protein
MPGRSMKAKPYAEAGAFAQGVAHFAHVIWPTWITTMPHSDKAMRSPPEPGPRAHRQGLQPNPLRDLIYRRKRHRVPRDSRGYRRSLRFAFLILRDQSPIGRCPGFTISVRARDRQEHMDFVKAVEESWCILFFRDHPETRDPRIYLHHHYL